MKHKKKILLLLSMLVLAFGCSLNTYAADTFLVECASGSGLQQKSSGQLSCSSYPQIRFVYSGEEQGVSGSPWVNATVKYSDGTSKTVLSYKSVEGVTNGSTTYTLEKTSGTFQIDLMVNGVHDDSHDETGYIAAYGVTHSHSWASAWTSDATYHWHKCSGCDQITGKAAHTWNAGTVTKAATCAATGVKTYTCTVCGKTKTETIPKSSAHTGTWQHVSGPSCTAAEVLKCSVCGATKAGASAKGHTYTLMPANS